MTAENNESVSLLSTPVVVIYNGIEFGSADLKTEISAECVMDPANRALEHVAFTFTFQRLFKTDNIQELLNKLTSPGGNLTIDGLGFVNMNINGDGPIYDADYGPKPRVLRCHPLAGSLWWDVTFEISTAIPHCYGGTPNYLRAIQSLTYSVTFAIDLEGMTTRTIEGMLKVPATRLSPTSHTVVVSADDWREVIQPKVPLGFARVSQNYPLSNDRRILSFSIVDREINSDSAYPDGIVSIRVTERIRNRAADMRMWFYSIDGTLSVARPFPKALAWQKFAMIVQERKNYQNQQGRSVVITRSSRTSERRGGVVMLTSLEIEDDVYGRSTNFSMSWMLASTLSSVIRVSGLFRPAQGSWETWRESMSLIWSQRGAANLAFTADQDVIVDLCGQDEVQTDSPSERLELEDDATQAGTTCPPPDQSWIHYELELSYRDASNQLRHKPLPLPGSVSDADAADDGDIYGTEASGPRVSRITVPDDIIQTRVGQTLTVYLRGTATRAGYDIPTPRIGLAFEDGVVSPSIEEEDVRRRIVGDTGSCPIYKADFNIRYSFVRTPGNGGQLVNLGQ
jgi:hypothetical protein